MILILIVFTVIQIEGAKDGDYKTWGVILAILIELSLVGIAVLMIKNLSRVTVSRESLALNDELINWSDVMYLRKVVLIDIYYLKLKNGSFIIFVGDRTPLGFGAFLFQGNEMEELIFIIKDKYEI